MRPVIGIIVILAVGIFGYTLMHAVYYAPQTDLVPTTTPIAAAVPAQVPVRLLIPSIGVDANVQQVGVTAKGNMGVPNNFTDVAWYRYGPAPGQEGSAVIDGHVDNGLSLPGVFKHLSDAKVGDIVQVRTKEGSTLTFMIDEVERYPMNAVPLDKVFTRNDAPRLVLITCTGTWVPGEKTYDTRLVVYAYLTGRGS